MLYERRHTYEIEEYGGLSAVMPVFAVLFMIVTLSSIGLPGLNGFVGEFLILVGMFQTHPWMTGFATVGVILAAYYMLRMFQRVMFGPVDREANRSLPDLSGRELAVLLPLVALIVWIGVYPAPFLARTEPSVERFVERVAGPAAETSPEVVEIAPAGPGVAVAAEAEVP
jgi:NADH-quinone oxidoreductase subunit M